jgi:8-oxo-dGTP diphosphatase
VNRINFTCGFLFRGCNEVLLVQKRNPRWQLGLLNGIGGKVGPFETFDDGMRREFLEETGRDVPDFKVYATEQNTQYATVYFYKARLPVADKWEPPPRNDVGEDLMWVNVSDIYDKRVTVGNLQWLIPLALDPRRLTRVNVISPLDNITERPTW